MPPSEPDITDPPPGVVAETARLNSVLDEVVPAKATGNNLLIGTWNLRALGGLTKAWETAEGASPKRNFADVAHIATIISRFDVVAVQEVRGDLRALRHVFKALGDHWAFVMTDVTKGSKGNDERLAFLFDTRRVQVSGLACELVVPVETDPEKIKPGAFNRQFARTPYAVSFTLSGKTFILVTLHVDYGKQAADRIPELGAIADWMANWAEQEEEWNHNLIALGDFNIDRSGDPLYDAFTSTGLTPAPQLNDVSRTIFDQPGKGHFYDQIAWFEKGAANRPVLSLTCSAAGTFDFVPELQGHHSLEDLSWHISDHYPLWVEFSLS